MKFSLLATAALMELVSAHYYFDTLVIDGKESKPNQFVRLNTRQAKYNPTKWVNTRDDTTPDLPDMRCNKGSFTNAGKTEVAEVKAGSKLAMKLAIGQIQHPGPGIVYMSKAPGSVKNYEGDGEWFKIFENSVCNKGADFKTDAWCTYNKDRIEFTVPAGVPDGEYLIRSEHIGVHGAHVGQAEFYMSCAQVKVTGGGNGTPGPTIKFPGGYKKTDPSFNFSIYNGFKEYPMPGPAVWDGASTASTPSNGSTEPSSAAPATPSKTPVAAPPATSAPKEEQHCNGKKQLRRGRRAFHETIRKE